MIGLVSFIVVSLVGLGHYRQAGDVPIKEYVDRYSDENGVSIEVLGACEITPSKLIAWDTKGKRSQELASLVSKYLERNQYPSLSFQFERKNRYIAVRHASPIGVNLSFQGADGPTFIFQTQGYGQPDESILLIPAYATKNQKETSLWATVPNGKVQMLDYKVKNKQSKKLPSGTWTLEAVKKLKMEDIAGIDDSFYVRYSMLEINNKAWTFNFKLPAPTPEQRTAFVLNPDDRGQIQIVDANGNPLKLTYQDLKPIAYDPVYHIPADPKSFASYAYTYTLRPNSANPIVATNINPANIKSIRLATMVTKKIAFVHIPLDFVSG